MQTLVGCSCVVYACREWDGTIGGKRREKVKHSGRGLDTLEVCTCYGGSGGKVNFNCDVIC